jgi:hypothetical protein
MRAPRPSAPLGILRPVALDEDLSTLKNRRSPSLKVCNKQADAKKLTGEARAQFVKDCQAGKHH